MSGIALGISASAPLSCALRLADGNIHLVPAVEQRGSDVAQRIDEVCRSAGIEPRELRELRIDLGPGSYTGLRASVSFAKVLIEFGGVHAFVATSFELLALAAWDSGDVGRDTPVRVVLDARRGRVHTALVRLAPRTVFDAEPRAIERSRAADTILRGECVLADASLHAELAEAADAQRARLVTLPEISATLLFHADLEARPAKGEDLVPLYLMGSYAED